MTAQEIVRKPQGQPPLTISHARHLLMAGQGYLKLVRAGKKATQWWDPVKEETCLMTGDETKQ